MYTLIAFATQWGPKHGGINSFNADFLSAFGIAYHHSAHTICVVSSAQADEIEQARNCHVELIPLPYSPDDKALGAAHGKAAVAKIQNRGIKIGENTIWLGHDRITGEAAIAAAQASEGRSAVIHHMSYDHYEAYAESAASAQVKVSQQNKIFSEADVLLAVGPLLRDALDDLARGSGKSVQMLIPGLAEIESLVAPATFSAFLSGRLSQDAARIKQGHLGIAAFAKAHGEACDNPGLPQALRKQPKLKLRGVDLEQTTASEPKPPSLESELKAFAEKYAQRVINLHALPFTHSREELYGELRSASVALMPSWHEGFGLVAWEAIAAGVPLIISRNSGVFQLLEEQWSGSGPGCVFSVDIRGKVDEPYFRDEDLNAVASLLKQIAQDPDGARRKAGNLRALVGDCTWAACAGQALESFGWSLQQGVIPETIPNTALVSTKTVGLISTRTETCTSFISIPTQVWQRGHGVADSQLLRAEEACVPFDDARQPELDKLQAWAENQEWPRALRLITGAGGSGKTRLALEFCERLAKQGWHTGFLAGEVEARQAGKIWQELHQLNQPKLIVIDYAETRQPVLLALVKAMLQASDSEQRVRLLLLARDGGEWWDQLPAKDALCEPLLNGRATSGPFILPELHPVTDTRPAAYTVALHAYAQALGVGAPHTIPDLQGEHFGRPLYLQMAALLALHGERPTTAEGLTRALLNHERRYWRGLLANYALPETEQSAAHLMALSTLVGGFATERDAEPYWQGSGIPLERPAFKTMFHALANLYPGKQGLQVLRPDLLGETLVAQALLGSDSDLILDAVLGRKASNEKRRHALTVLARIVGRRTDLDAAIQSVLVRQFVHCATTLIAVNCETPGPLSRLTEEAFLELTPSQKSQAVGLLEPLLRQDSVLFVELNCHIREFIVVIEKLKANKKPRPTELSSLANALNSCGTAHSRAGHFEKALNLSQQSTEILGKLTNSSSTYLADYASALGNCSLWLSELGQLNEALQQQEISLKIYHRLFESKPDRHEANYAISLSNLSNRLRDVGQTNEALEYAWAAFNIRKRLAENDPDRHEPGYAASLTNIAGCLRDTGDYELAIIRAEEALKIKQRLAETNPDRFEPDYAIALSNYAAHLSDLGETNKALEHAQKGLEIDFRLAETRPTRYLPDYGSDLINIASYLKSLGQVDAALDYAKRALEIFSQLAHTRRDRFEPDYAISLNNIADHLCDVGEVEKAMEHAKTALEIRHRLAEKRPNRYELEYSNSLCNMAACLSNAGEIHAALEHIQAALIIFTRLAHETPRRFDGEHLITACITLLYSWLNGESVSETEIPDQKSLPVHLIPHHRRNLILISKFVLGCVTSTADKRLTAFSDLCNIWPELSVAEQESLEDYWLCAAAYCSCVTGSDINWHKNWTKFISQRQNLMPRWMEYVARKLKFSWPDVQQSI